MRQALSRSLRSLRRAPGFVAIATLSLGAALGLSTSVFALIDAMRNPRSPFGDIDHFYTVYALQRSKDGPRRAELEAAVGSVRGIEAVSSALFVGSDVEIGEGVTHHTVIYARPELFPMLRMSPDRGRLPAAADAIVGNVAVVGSALWRREFNGRAHVEGTTLAINGRTYSIIGVMPDRASLLSYDKTADIWIPDRDDAATAGNRLLFVRVAAHQRAISDFPIKTWPNETKDIQSQLAALARRWTSLYAHPGEKPFQAVISSLRPDPLQLQDFHKAMIGAAICVLIIACANVAALMLARGMVRRRDYALRLALGARRSEIAREVIVEVAVLAIAGCAAGGIIATWAVGVLTRTIPDELHWQGFVQPQWSVRVLALSALAVIVSIALAGGFPAWQASRTDPMQPLKESGGGTTGRAGTRFRWLIMAELSLAMMLVMIASLLMKSTNKMSAFDFGYDARGLLTVEIQLPSHDSTAPAPRAALYQQLLSRIKALPGVRDAASFVQCDFADRVVTSDRTVEGGKAAYVAQGCYQGSAGLFHTLGIAMADGRDFIDGDDAGNGAVILDQRTAAKLFPHERAIGHLIKLGPIASASPFMPIVGVVRNHDLAFNRYPETGPDTSDRVYVAPPFMKRTFGDMVIRPNPADKLAKLEVTRVLRSTMPPHSTANIRPWFKSYQDELREEQFLSIVFNLLGVASLLLGAAGLFSVISYVVGQRMREFAVRFALGATNGNVLRLVMREALLMALGGTGVGAGLGMWAGFLLWNKMWGVYPVDAGALIAGELTLLIVTMLACLVPALRATRANPVDVLRAA
jgi:putative ABC transport system permease protein